MSAATRIALVAGEASGDLLAAPVVDALHQLASGGAQAAGIGGPAMQAAGFEAWASIRELSVNGFAEVLRHYPRLRRLQNTVRDRAIDWQPAAFVGVDAPDFNLSIERATRARGIPTIHFIGPSIWAWRRERIERIRESVDHVLLLFPFEEAIYREAGIPATFVGHPLADRIPAQPDRESARQRLGMFPTPGLQVVALLPGSRRGEVDRLVPDFLRAAAQLHIRRPDVRFLLPAANDMLFDRIRRHAEQLKLPADMQLTILSGRSHDAIEAADTVLVASGTATLEVALYQRPMVVAYRLALPSYWIMRRMAYLPWISLPNILCNAEVVPEFVQSRVQPQALAIELQRQLEDEPHRAVIGARFAELNGVLRRDAGRRAAEKILEVAGVG